MPEIPALLGGGSSHLWFHDEFNSQGLHETPVPPNKLINRWRIAEILSSESPQLPDCSSLLSVAVTKLQPKPIWGQKSFFGFQVTVSH